MDDGSYKFNQRAMKVAAAGMPVQKMFQLADEVRKASHTRQDLEYAESNKRWLTDGDWSEVITAVEAMKDAERVRHAKAKKKEPNLSKGAYWCIRMVLQDSLDLGEVDGKKAAEWYVALLQAMPSGGTNTKMTTETAVANARSLAHFWSMRPHADSKVTVRIQKLIDNGQLSKQAGLLEKRQENKEASEPLFDSVIQRIARVDAYVDEGHWDWLELQCRDCIHKKANSLRCRQVIVSGIKG